MERSCTGPYSNNPSRQSGSHWQLHLTLPLSRRARGCFPILWLEIGACITRENKKGSKSAAAVRSAQHSPFPWCLTMTHGLYLTAGFACPCKLFCAGKDVGCCLPSSWSLTCAPWLGTLGRRASSRNNLRCCSPEGALPAGTAYTTALRLLRSPSTSCSPRTAEGTQMSISAIRGAPCHPKINQHLDHCPGFMAV